MAATLTDEAREECEQYIGRLLDKWEVPLDLRIAIAAGGANVRNNVVTALRDQLVRKLRDTCWQSGRTQPQKVRVKVSDPGIPWVRLSTLSISSLLGMTHGGVVRSLQRTAAHPAFACYKPKVDELPEVTVRRLRDEAGDELPPLKPTAKKLSPEFFDCEGRLAKGDVDTAPA